MFLADENKLKAAQEISENFEVSSNLNNISAKQLPYGIMTSP